MYIYLRRVKNHLLLHVHTVHVNVIVFKGTSLSKIVIINAPRVYYRDLYISYVLHVYNHAIVKL